MGKNLTIFESRIQRKRSIPSDRAWNSEQKSILQQVPYSNTWRNTAIWRSKYCQFDYDLDKIWRQSYSNWQYFKLHMAVFPCVFEYETCCSILFCSKFHALSDGINRFCWIRLSKIVNFLPIFCLYSFAYNVNLWSIKNFARP